MAKSEKIFRDKALVKFASPEELDKTIQVTDVKGWLAFIGLFLLVLAGIIWSIVGSIPTITRGTGILFPPGGLREIKAPTSGQLSEITIRSGDIIKEAQVVGKFKNATGQETELRSPFTGTVVEVLAEPDSSINSQAPIATVEQTDRPLQAIVFVPLTEGKQLRPGLKVQLSPSNIRAEEYGYLLGTIGNISPLAVSSDSLLLTFKNRDLVQILNGTGPVVRVDVNLEPDSTSNSGFKWSSSKGPQFNLSSGTLCSADLILNEQRPITLVFPFIK